MTKDVQGNAGCACADARRQSRFVRLHTPVAPRVLRTSNHWINQRLNVTYCTEHEILFIKRALYAACCTLFIVTNPYGILSIRRFNR